VVRTIGLLSDHAPDEIPASHRDLAQCPPIAALSTVTAGGYPQTSVVWCDFDGRYVRINTMRGFAKERNMRRNPRVTLLCYDPHQPFRYLEVRGTVVEMTQTGAAEHLDALASKYASSATPSRPHSPRPRLPSCAGSGRPALSRSTQPGRPSATGTKPSTWSAPACLSSLRYLPHTSTC